MTERLDIAKQQWAKDGKALKSIHPCPHTETEGFRFQNGICKSCTRDLDVWEILKKLEKQIDRLNDDFFKLWVKTLGLADTTISKCCKAPLELAALDKQYHCSKCGKML